ncbi:exopolyphosphatase [Angustibacter sp. McL0619]|uniref:Ppx/GppA phosphatase family protein n=1 Tax=Angustibacter sp. McL0619 TaxID=3415676 RepID=UPI003CF2397C
MTRVAAIDCGTNSLRMLVADVDRGAGTLVDVERQMEIVRLGQGIDRTGRIAPAALERTLKVTADYAVRCRELGVEAMRFVATSASRDAENRDEFVVGVRELLGVEPEVVPGLEEAQLAFAGATFELAAAGGGPFLVVDIGGGSTELVRGDDSVESALSVDIGCVRLTERHLHSDPPTQVEVAAARADIEAGLDRIAEVVALQGIRTVVGVAGSVTNVTATALELTEYDPARIHRTELAVDVARLACDELLAMSRAQRAALPFMHPGRVDVIGAGALIWRMVIDRMVAESGIASVVASERDILDGIAFSIT